MKTRHVNSSRQLEINFEDPSPEAGPVLMKLSKKRPHAASLLALVVHHPHVILLPSERRAVEEMTLRRKEILRAQARFLLAQEQSRNE